MTIPAWFWTWARWYLGRSEYKGHARDPKLRPASAPTRIPAWAWAELVRRFLKPAAPKPPAPTLADLGRNVMFTAWNPAAAVSTPKHWTVALSADPAFEAAVLAALPKIRANGNRIAVWGVQTQIGVDRIRAFAKKIGATIEIMQAEDSDQYETSKAAGAKLVVGNPNAWTDAQRADATARAQRGEVAFLMEVYTNAGEPWPSVASSRNVPIVSEVLGVGWGATPYQLADYGANTPAGVWKTIGVYLAENMSPGSWALLP